MSRRTLLRRAVGACVLLCCATIAAPLAHGQAGATATPPSAIKAPKGFKVELIYSVPKASQGSWVNMCVDPRGRLIVSDQYGLLYRVTPPDQGVTTGTKVERIPADIGEAHGMVWAFDALYVVVNRGTRFTSGLYRITDSDGDDTLDKVQLLKQINGSGEHGPHAVVLAPDGKSLYVMCGNGTRLIETQTSLVPRIYGEDSLLTRMKDPRFMQDELAPDGVIYKTDKDGRQWELVSIGFRNHFDAAFNRSGELFTFDSDMEWDFNTPWYRPTRVCHVISGADWGCRNGAGKMPIYYADSVPPTVNIGPGSPTGVAFGYGANFPAKYQEAMFICDWSYGKLYAVHLEPSGATYKGTVEDFLSGTPLPLTDIVVEPFNQVVYFTTGGRRTQSGLYRLSYVGEETGLLPNDPPEPTALAAERRKLEAFHGKQDPAAIDAAWPSLNSPDRFVRYAARVAVEHQDPKLWQDRALAEKDPWASVTALLALSRAKAIDPQHRKAGQPANDRTLLPKIVESLERLDWNSLDTDQKLALLRVYEVAFNRFGAPDDDVRVKTMTKLDAVFPSKSKDVDVELSNVLIFLKTPSAATKTVALLQAAPTQEEQIDYARALRVLHEGWTPDLRKTYFSWFLKAADLRGGTSFAGFMKNIKDDAMATLTAEERIVLGPVLNVPAATTAGRRGAPTPARPEVRKWKLDELEAIVEKGLHDRDFERGRTLFGAASCFSCHRFSNDGGANGPDLTGAAGRFNRRDLLESIVEPSKVISDQYAAIRFQTIDGLVVIGRVANQREDQIEINTNMMEPGALTNVKTLRITSMEPSKISMMPEGLLNPFHEDEVLDLVAFLLSRGDRNDPMFKKRQ